MYFSQKVAGRRDKKARASPTERSDKPKAVPPARTYLTPEEIRSEENHLVIAKQMEKTREWVVIPLNKEAASFLPPKKGTFVFDLPSSTAANADLKRWARAAGIRKIVTFHTARHTFATLLLTLGADLYTTSKLLGHTNITTTQIYAEVVNEKKSRAVRLMDGLL